ncbi:hypothetical protein CYMTET_49345 [Cymbomonas tetramitiformis]|uniref:Uncharacterized protein n=1 Tax=Cymbomonas tetramitiformis TaxID=36881 RepID=A0AAE0EU85_9CHLO|nr:hypothetical protein CYMTET_49345 [Cymbomonas tetramitiformis]
MTHPVSPLVPRVPPSVSVLKDRAWRNLLKLTATFFLIFCPFLSLQNLESSLQNKGGLGALANATIYCSIAIFSPFAPLVVCNKHVGPKRAIVASAIAYTVFSAANLFPHRYTLLPAAALLGSAASVLWVSQATYLMSVSAMNACATATHFAAALSRFNSIFWGVFQTAGVMGNLFAWGLIHVEGENFKRATYSDLSQDSDFEGQPLGRSKFHLTIAFTSLSGIALWAPLHPSRIPYPKMGPSVHVRVTPSLGGGRATLLGVAITWVARRAQQTLGPSARATSHRT